MKLKFKFLGIIFSVGAALSVAIAGAYDDLSVPDEIENEFLELELEDGVPDKESIKDLYGFVDFYRNVEVFNQHIPVSSLHALYTSYLEVTKGKTNDVLIMEQLLDSKPLFLTGNTDTVYAYNFIDLKKGPVVVEVPPAVLGTVNDHRFRFVTDMGLTGPDKGKGGKFLIYPPNMKPKKVKGYYVSQSPTYINWVILRAFQSPKDGLKTPVDNYKKFYKAYPYGANKEQKDVKYYNVTGKNINTIHSSNHKFYIELDEVVQYEPADLFSADEKGLLASVGINRGSKYELTGKQKKLLDQAAYTGSAYARALLYEPRDENATVYKDTNWITAFIGGSYKWLTKSGARNFDARSYFFYMATVNTPAMVLKFVGKGSQYALVTKDSKDQYFEGDETYRLRIPPNVPVKNFWSFVIYDNQTRSMLQTQEYPSLNSLKKGLQKNEDGSIDIYIGPKTPKGFESNFIKSDPKKGWWAIFRWYGPTEKFYDQSWKLDDIEQI
jgi:hypothetical protein